MPVSRHVAAAFTAAVLALGLGVVPVEATVHEIVAQWCSGQDDLNPPGLSRQGSRNFAQPLNATGILTMTFNEELGGVLVSFDFDHPATKIQSSGVVIPIGTTDDGTPLFLDVPEPDPSFPAFQHCPALAGV